jgi:hypothetical protein
MTMKALIGSVGTRVPRDPAVVDGEMLTLVGAVTAQLERICSFLLAHPATLLLSGAELDELLEKRCSCL